MKRKVTEGDLRDPAYGNSDVSEYERREDGKIVRKDRWERGIICINNLLKASNHKNIDVTDVVVGVRELKEELSESKNKIAQLYLEAAGKASDLTAEEMRRLRKVEIQARLAGIDLYNLS